MTTDSNDTVTGDLYDKTIFDPTVEQSGATVEPTVEDSPNPKRAARKVAAVKKPAKKRTKGRGESATSPRRIKAVEEKQLAALEYRKMGYTYAQIAESLGYATAQGAYCAIQSALTRIIREPAEEVLKIELERLDAMFVKPYQAATNGDLMAIGTCLNIMARKAKFLGIDAPARSEISGPNGAPVATTVHNMTQADMDAAAKRLLEKY
jgi:hypothetical protein